MWYKRERHTSEKSDVEFCDWQVFAPPIHSSLLSIDSCWPSQKFIFQTTSAVWGLLTRQAYTMIYQATLFNFLTFINVFSILQTVSATACGKPMSWNSGQGTYDEEQVTDQLKLYNNVWGGESFNMALIDFLSTSDGLVESRKHPNTKIDHWPLYFKYVCQLIAQLLEVVKLSSVYPTKDPVSAGPPPLTSNPRTRA